MYGNTQAGSESTPFPRRIGPRADVAGGEPARATREPVVRAASLKAAIVQLRGMAEANAGRSSRQALVANLMVLRGLGVDEEVLDLVVEMVLVQNVDEEMTAAINCLASGFLLALLTFQEERGVGVVRPPTMAQPRLEDHREVSAAFFDALAGGADAPNIDPQLAKSPETPSTARTPPPVPNSSGAQSRFAQLVLDQAKPRLSTGTGQTSRASCSSKAPECQ
jgi:hypothetical protein